MSGVREKREVISGGKGGRLCLGVRERREVISGG